MTPLHYACRYSHKDVVSVLLANNANLEAKDIVSIFIFFEMMMNINNHVGKLILYLF